MTTNFRFAICTVVLCCGCPLSGPRDHSRPVGQTDCTIAISPQDDALLFNGLGKGKRDLYLLDLTDLKVTRIAETEEYETAASFSDDGEWIVYSAGIPGDRADHLFKIKRDGSSKTQLTSVDANDNAARFSPDGSKIVFARDKSYNWGGLASNWELGGVICIVDANGKNFRQLTIDGQYAFDPCFSTDGKNIIYSTTLGRMSVLADGSAAPKSIAGPAGATQSMDEKWIAYSKGKFSPDLKIYIAKTDGTAELCVTPKMGGCDRPVFTTSAKRIFFLREQWSDGLSDGPHISIWEVGVDGSGLKGVTDHNLFGDPLNWKASK